MQLDAPTLAAIDRKIGWGCLVLGIMFLTGAGYWAHLLHMDVFLFHPSTAVGEVIENKKEQVTSQDSKTHTSHSYIAYRAIVRFKDAHDKSIILLDPLAFSTPSFEVGDNVVVLYNPNHPENAMIDRGRKNSIIPLIIGFFSFFLILGGVQRLAKKPI